MEEDKLIKAGKVEYHSELNGILQIRIISKKLSEYEFHYGDKLLIEISKGKIIVENIEGKKIIIEDQPIPT